MGRGEVVPLTAPQVLRIGSSSFTPVGCLLIFTHRGQRQLLELGEVPSWCRSRWRENGRPWLVVKRKQERSLCLLPRPAHLLLLQALEQVWPRGLLLGPQSLSMSQRLCLGCWSFLPTAPTGARGELVLLLLSHALVFLFLLSVMYLTLFPSVRYY